MTVHITIKPDFVRSLRPDQTLPRRLHDALRAALAAAGRDVVGAAKAGAPRDTGRLANSMDSVLLAGDELSVIIFNRAKYSLWVHDGATYRDKPPPYKALIQWARRHLAKGIASAKLKKHEGTIYAGMTGRIMVPRDQAISLAIAVARSIQKRGYIKGRPWIRDAIDRRTSTVASLLNRSIASALAGP